MGLVSGEPFKAGAIRRSTQTIKNNQKQSKVESFEPLPQWTEAIFIDVCVLKIHHGNAEPINLKTHGENVVSMLLTRLLETPPLLAQHHGFASNHSSKH